jgi:osmotically inducible protein OsmC
MQPFERQATLTWEGTLRAGEGAVRAGTGAFTLPVSFPSRVAQSDGRTSPEELLAAAHAACYAMAIEATLARRGATAARLHVSATVQAEFGEAGLVLRGSHLRVMADGLNGIEPARFMDVAREAEARCPISNVLRGNIRIDVEAIA